MEKRHYSRIQLSIPCLVYLENREYICILNDISRNGISFEFTKKAVMSDSIQFSFLYGNILVTGSADITNTRYEDDSVIYGCEFLETRQFDIAENIEINAAVNVLIKRQMCETGLS